MPSASAYLRYVGMETLSNLPGWSGSSLPRPSILSASFKHHG